MFAVFKSLPPPHVVRAGVACSAFAAPFFALREVVAASMKVDGPVASAITGGFAGYFGALIVTGPNWNAVTHTAMAAGLGAGLVDAVVGGVEWKRKMWLVNRADRLTASASLDVDPKTSPWPVWFPVVKQADEEYEKLLTRQQAIVVALEEEQQRIKTLLRAIETLKAAEANSDLPTTTKDVKDDSDNEASAP